MKLPAPKPLPNWEARIGNSPRRCLENAIAHIEDAGVMMFGPRQTLPRSLRKAREAVSFARGLTGRDENDRLWSFTGRGYPEGWQSRIERAIDEIDSALAAARSMEDVMNRGLGVQSLLFARNAVRSAADNARWRVTGKGT